MAQLSTLTPVRSWRSQFIELAPAALLLLLLLWSVVQSVATANWGPHLEILVAVTLPAAVAGIVFARLRWLPAWLAHLLSAALGLVWTVGRLAPLLDERLLRWPDQATELLIRTIIWGRVIASGGRGEDIVLFVAALSLLAWLLGYLSAWLVFRRGWIWRVVLINAAVILTNYTYVLPKPTLLFFIFLSAGLLLVVYQNVLARQERWAAADVEYPELLPLRFMWAASLVCAATVALTSVLPGSVPMAQASRTWDTISRPFKLAKEVWEDAFSTIQAPPGTITGSFAARGAQLGGGRALSDGLAMYVYASRFDYWRAVAFDKYADGRWQNTVGEQARAAVGASSAEGARTPFDAGVTIPRTEIRGRAVVTQTMVLAADRKDDLIFVGGEVAQVSLPVRVEHSYQLAPGGIRAPNFDDTALIVSQSPLRQGSTYTVTALVSLADVRSLRQAGDNYPDWVRERYLQLPDTITPRTIARADEIVRAAGATNPYDIAVAFEEYLRTLPYNERISAPPAGFEPVDYFLFDLRQGFCDYYASAMVVMLRSQGVPARWVRGYAGGVFDPERGAYAVRENVAHTWPEVYFPGFGWERFEPTPAAYTALAQRPLAPLTGDDELEPGLAMDSPATGGDAGEDFDEALRERARGPIPGANSPARFDLESIRVPLTVAVVAIGLFGLAAAALLLRWRHELRGLSPVGAAYAQMALLGGWAGVPQRPHTTPAEYAAELSQALPVQRAIIGRIARAYSIERYRGRPGAGPDTNFAPELKELRGATARRIIARLSGGLRREETA